MGSPTVDQLPAAPSDGGNRPHLVQAVSHLSRQLVSSCSLEQMSEMPTSRLVRPRSGRVIAGVAAGLADRFGMSRKMMRLLFILSLILPGPQVLIYLILWIVIPEE